MGGGAGRDGRAAAPGPGPGDCADGSRGVGRLAPSARPGRRAATLPRTARGAWPRCRPQRPNEAWSLDFIHDELSNGKKFRALTVVDVFSREGLAIEVGHRLRGEHVVDVLNRLVRSRGAPKYLFADNGAGVTLPPKNVSQD